MVSGRMMVEPSGDKGAPKMAKNKSATSKSPSKQQIKGGPKGGMHKFSGLGPQESGISSVSPHAGKGAPFAKAGPSGKMQKFTGVAPQKPGGSAVTNTGGKSYAK
jgi:hypothetical protein